MLIDFGNNFAAKLNGTLLLRLSIFSRHPMTLLNSTPNSSKRD
jgi:hypothetical protein